MGFGLDCGIVECCICLFKNGKIGKARLDLEKTDGKR